MLQSLGHNIVEGQDREKGPEEVRRKTCRDGTYDPDRTPHIYVRYRGYLKGMLAPARQAQGRLIQPAVTALRERRDRL